MLESQVPIHLSASTAQVDSGSHTIGRSTANVYTRTIRAEELEGQLAARWEELRSANQRLTSPYFDVEFTRAVAKVRDDVRISLLIDQETEDVVGFLPYQQVSPIHGEPVGGRLNDWHGLITEETQPAARFKQVLSEAGLRSFGIHAATNYDASYEPYIFEAMKTYHLDLSDGWNAYRKWIRKHSSTVKRQGQKTRGLEREVGPISFEFDCPNATVLEELIDLKRAKYQRTKTFDILSVEWAANLLREIFQIQKPQFKGLLSVLRAGDKLIAVHFGMLTGDTLHYWFPTFDNQYSRYSPGTELLMQVAEEASRRGIKKVDLGYGDDPYKLKFSNGFGETCCGRINFSRIGFHAAKQRYIIRKKLKGIPMKPLAKKLLRGVFPGFGQWNFK